jgi:hypothetical protein
VLFPRSCTSVIQPLDKGIIKNAKVNYSHPLIQRISIDKNRDLKANINARQGTEMMASGWWDVSDRKIANYWKIPSILFASKIAKLSSEDISVSEEFCGRCLRNFILTLH